MDFSSNTFTLQSQGAYILYLEKKIQGKNFHALFKNCENHKSLAQWNFPCLWYALKITNATGKWFQL